MRGRVVCPRRGVFMGGAGCGLSVWRVGRDRGEAESHSRAEDNVVGWRRGGEGRSVRCGACAGGVRTGWVCVCVCVWRWGRGGAGRGGAGGGECGYACGVWAETEERGTVTARPRTTQCVWGGGEGGSLWCVACAAGLGVCVCLGGYVCVRSVQAGCVCGYACDV